MGLAAARLPLGLALVLALMLPQLPRAAVAQPPAEEARSKVEAAFLRNFARYIVWPAQAFDNARSPWAVCLLGEDRLGESLPDTLKGRIEQGRSFEIRQAEAPEALSGCHIVFITIANPAQRRLVLARLKDKPVLTVGNAVDFLAEGGVIRLLPGERMEMGVNLDQARNASLGIPTKLLEVSRDVLENGVLRRLR
ncbi:YfiR family protein [Roseateles sp.]|uniref:YfiR family protein n=1 Tax=Roseateles sp. TaxID=1971397 RepID=UPI00326626E3